MNRRALILASLAALPATALPVAASPQHVPARRHRAAGTSRGRRRNGLVASHVRTRIITRAFTSNVPITIPAGAPANDQGPASHYPSIIKVSGFNQGRIRKVRVTLIGLTHTAVGELHVMVAAPGNTGVILLSDTGDDENADDITLIYDQAAPGTLLETDPMLGGAYQPKNGGPGFDLFPPPAPQGVSGHSLTVFNNRNPNGTWRLFIVDDGPNDTGNLRGWALTIQARVHVPHRHRAKQRRSPRGER